MTVGKEHKTFIAWKYGFNTFELRRSIFLQMKLYLLMVLLFFISTGLRSQTNPIAPTFKKYKPTDPSKSYSTSTPSQNYPSNAPSNPVMLMNNQTKMSVQDRNKLALQRMNPNAHFAPTQAEIQAKIERERVANYQQSYTYQEQQRQNVYTILNEVYGEEKNR